MPNHVFVYGTLLFPEVTQRLGIESLDSSGKPTSELRRIATVLLGYERFAVRLRDVGNFPAIVSSPDAVNGEVLLDLTDESLRKLDRFEGVDSAYYERKTVRIHIGKEGLDWIRAETYVCGDLLRDKLDGEWNPDLFRENELDWYLKNVMS